MKLEPHASRLLRGSHSSLFIIASSLLQELSIRPELIPGIRHQVKRDLDAERSALMAAGIPEPMINDVQMPIVALLDEAAAKNPSVRDYWKAIALEFYQHLTIGHRLFQRLNELRIAPTPVEILEFYARCLSWGFKGEYSPNRLADLEILRESLLNDIRRRQENMPELVPALTAMQHITGKWVLRYWWALVVAGMMAIFTYGMFTLLLWRSASQVTLEVRQVANSLAVAANARDADLSSKE